MNNLDPNVSEGLGCLLISAAVAVLMVGVGLMLFLMAHA